MLRQIPSLAFSQHALLYVLRTLAKLVTSVFPKRVFYFPRFVSFVMGFVFLGLFFLFDYQSSPAQFRPNSMLTS